ncbi:rad60-SLD domain-containing protein [Trichonephila clavipes]|nr:rad60-SLD domain-containing protein [Trichonephila clavipes]
MMDGCSDDEDSPVEEIFSGRADKIIQSQHEAFEKLLTKGTENNALKEPEDIMIKIREKLERKRPVRKAKAGASSPKKSKKKVSPPQRRRGRSRWNKEDEIQEIESQEEALPVNLPAKAKKRLKKLELKTSRQGKRMDQLNQRILSAFNTIEDDSTCIDITEQEVNLKIRYLYEILRLDVNEDESFASILSKVAELLKIKPSEIVLCLDDKTIDLNATPFSMNIKSWNIIDCIPYKPSDEDNILIKMQSNDSKKKIDMYAHKFDQFKEIMEKYANLRDLPLKDLIFEFDGEKINASDTPEDLDMESGSCVDVKVTGDSFKSKPSTSTQFIDLENDIPKDQMMQICVLD